MHGSEKMYLGVGFRSLDDTMEYLLTKDIVNLHEHALNKSRDKSSLAL